MLGNKVVKNASWIIGCRIVQSVLGFVISMLTARYLGPSNYGLINYAASLVTFVVPLMNLGLSNILVSETVKLPEEEGKIFGTSIILSFFSSIVCICSVIGFAFISKNGDRETVIVCALYGILLIFQALELIQYWFQAKYLSKYSSIVSVCAYFVISVYKIFLLATGKSIYWFAVSNAIDYMIISVTLLIIYRRLGGKKLQFSFSVAKRMLSSSRHYIISSLMVNIFAQTDKIMISLMLGDEYTGYYTAAVACAGITNFIFAAIIDSARPTIFESKKDDNSAAFENKVSSLYSIIIYLSLLQCVGMTLLAYPIIFILYGEAYLTAVPALQIIVWYTTFSYLGSVRNIWILAENKQKYLWIINMSGALANVVLNAVMIPNWGILGAAAASLITQIFTNVVIGFIMKPILKNNKLMIRGLNPKHLAKLIKKIK